MKNRVIVGAVAGVVALLTAVLMYNYAAGADERATSKVELVPVWTAAVNIPAGTSFGDAIVSDQIVASEIPRIAVPETAVTEVAALDGQIAGGVIVAGQVLVEGLFVSPDEFESTRGGPPTFARRVPTGRVAVSFRAGILNAVANLIQPGDKVNMLVLVPNTDDLGLPPSEGKAFVHVFQNLDILAIGKSEAPDPGADFAPVNPGTEIYTTHVDAEDAARVLLLTTSFPVFLTLVPDDQIPTVIPPIDRLDALPRGLTPLQSAEAHERVAVKIPDPEPTTTTTAPAAASS